MHEQNLFAKIAFLLASFLLLYPLMAIFFFESGMFPTIFALVVKKSWSVYKKGGSYIIMSIVGAGVPVVLVSLTQSNAMQFSYIVLLICPVIVFFFAMYGYKIKTQ